MKYGKIEYGVSGAYYKEDEDKIIQEAADRLDDNLRDKFDAYEEGYGTYFKDFELWFKRYAPEIWSDVLEEAQNEKMETEEELRERYENECIASEREKVIYGSYDEQVRQEYYRDRI